MKKIILILSLFSAINMWGGMKYYDASVFPLYGKAAGETKLRYSRLPDSLENVSRKPVWNLSLNSAGMFIRFASNSTAIGAKWKSLVKCEMNHMTPTGIRGLDLYAMEPDGSWRFVNSARPNLKGKNSETTIISNMDSEMREYMLYLPLYDGVDSLYIGIDSIARIEAPAIAKPTRELPLVFYGTSILQGGCASRAGMAHTNMISRRLNREVFNFGFSGNGQLDYEVAEVMASVKAGMFILDFVPNVTIKQIDERMEHFYRIIRDKHPKVPILFIEDPNFTHTHYSKAIAKEVKDKNEALKRNYELLKKAGEKNIYYLKGDNILGKDGEATVDAIHFTDIGFTRYTELLLPIIKSKALRP